jgi:hypothetical protein
MFSESPCDRLIFIYPTLEFNCFLHYKIYEFPTGVFTGTFLVHCFIVAPPYWRTIKVICVTKYYWRLALDLEVQERKGTYFIKQIHSIHLSSPVFDISSVNCTP